jgi:NAD(P)-dependent dehydrogenase (short-subunit alcohol dehydrogenase family)
MSAAPVAESDLGGQTVVVIGGSSGIGLATARAAKLRGAEVVLAARDVDRLSAAAELVDARAAVVLELDDLDAVDQFFVGLVGTVDHVLVTGPGPYYSSLADMDFARARREVGDRLLTPLVVGRAAAPKVRPGGSLAFMGGTGGRSSGVGMTLISALSVGLQAMAASLALELAPVRVNVIAAGFVDTPLSASLLGDDLDARRAELRSTLPIGRVVGPDDVAAIALHLMTNTALTGATYDVDGGQQLLSNHGGAR